MTHAPCQHCNHPDSWCVTVQVSRPDDGKSLCRELRLCRVCGREFVREIKQVFRKFNQYPNNQIDGT